MIIGLLLPLQNVFAGSTLDNRDKSSFMVGITPWGFHVPSLATRPVTFGLYVGKVLMLGVESGEISNKQSDKDAESTASFSNQGVYARLFTGNSFNFLFAVHQRTWKGEATMTKSVYNPLTFQNETAYVTADIEASAKIGTFGLGNQWITDTGIVIGIDWLALSGQLGATNKVTIKTNSGMDSTQAKDDLRVFNDFLNIVSTLPGFFILQLGYAF